MGGSIIEMVVVLLAAAALTVLGIKQDVAHHRSQLLAVEGQNELTIVQALGEWANDNYATALAQYMASGSPTITPPTIAQLFTAGNLKQPHGIGPFWGGAYVIQMSMVPAGCTEAAGNCSISYAMFPSLPLKKGAQFDVDGASQIAQAGGAQFGFSRTQGASTINGLNGGWSATNPLGNVPAVVLATNGPGTDGNSLFIRRDGSLTWTGNQNVNGVDLDNVGNVFATETVQGKNLNAVNGTQTTSIANDGSGNTTVSQNGALQVMQSGTGAFAPLNAGNITSSGTIEPANIAIAEASCPTNGATAAAADGSGLPFTCQLHVWVPNGGRLQGQQLFVVANGSVVPSPSCPGGGVQKIEVAAQNFSVDNTATVNFGPPGGTGPWTITITDGTGTVIPGEGEVVTYCQY